MFLQIGLLAVLLTTITGVVSIDDFWQDEWDIVIISLQVAALFLLTVMWCCFKHDLVISESVLSNVVPLLV